VPRRSAVSRPGRAMAAVLLGVLALAPLAAPARAETPGATVYDTPTPDTPSPTDTDTTSPTPTPSPTPVDSPTPSPTPAPPPTTPAPATTPAAPPTTPAAPPRVLAVTVMADNAVLGTDYWSGDGAASFVVTVKNTGTVPARVNLRYTVPPGVTDAASGACAHGTCLVDPLAPGAVRSLPVAVDVDPDAWRHAPLAGKVDFSATTAGAAAATGTVNWGVIFPPGPPAAGIALQVADVTLEKDVTVPGQLVIRLTNTGARAAAGLIDLVVPAGVTVAPLPPDCQTQRQVDPSTTECGLGSVPAGVQRAIAIPLVVGDSARADAPLAGLVRASLTPPGQASRSTQASFQIIAPQVQSGVSAATTASPVPQHVTAATTPDRGDPAAPMIIFASLVVLALVAMGLILVRQGDLFRRRPRRGGLPPPETKGSWRPVSTFVPPEPRPKPDTPVPAAVPAALPAAEPAVNAESDAAESGPGPGEPIGIGDINLEWRELPDSTPPPGSPVG
jgi:hypothetical protein